jgi:hypothetical protein
VVDAVVVEGQAVDERLRDGLDGEQVVVVAGADHVAVERGHRQAEPVGLDLQQLGDVRRDLAFVVAPERSVDARQTGLHRRPCHRSPLARPRNDPDRTEPAARRRYRVVNGV